jgi:GSH-dependent disulfide-bond oxidoreductase
VEWSTNSVIDLFTTNSPNGFKATIALEEAGIPYRPIWIHSGADAAAITALQAISPAGKVPALFDHETGAALFESGAILLYVAERSNALLPRNPVARWEAVSWLFLHAASFGPMFGQYVHFAAFAETHNFAALDRYRRQVEDTLVVLERRLDRRETLADGYSIADIAHFGWVHAAAEWGVDIVRFTAVEAWRQRLLLRPAVKRGLAMPSRLEDVHLRWAALKI